MTQKLLLLLATGFVLFFGLQLTAQTIEGDYLVGETKATIKIENDEYEYAVVHLTHAKTQVSNK